MEAIRNENSSFEKRLQNEMARVAAYSFVKYHVYCLYCFLPNVSLALSCIKINVFFIAAICCIVYCAQGDFFYAGCCTGFCSFNQVFAE